MEADFVRLILFVTGAFLVLGIYLWERRKRTQTRDRTPLETPPEKVEPSFRSAPEDSVELEDGAEQEPANIEEELEQLNRIVSSELGAAARSGKAASGSEKQRSIGSQGDLFGFTSETRSRAGSGTGHPVAPVPKLIMQINVAARHRPFSGDDIDRVCQEVDLQAGDMNIFHRLHKEGGGRQVVFSMANMVEPGTFPMDDLNSFSSPGLTLFAQLPGPLDGLATLSDMLFSAERIAAMLDGELQDETHSVLSKQTIEHMRSQILEHRRQVQLAHKKA